MMGISKVRAGRLARGDHKPPIGAPHDGWVRADAVITCSANQARLRLWQLLSDSTAGCGDDERIDVELVVGPRRNSSLRKRVVARLSNPRPQGPSFVYDLHWAPIGAFAPGYPKLDARLAITPIDETSCLLTLAGAYRPPLGPIGHVADEAALHRLAESTAKAITSRLAALAASRVVAGHTSR